MYKLMILLLIVSSLFAQEKKEKIEGSVSFISSQHVYIKFDLTDGLSIGDTLFTIEKDKLNPSLIIKFISTKSVAAEKLLNISIEVNNRIIAFRRVLEKKQDVNVGDEKLIEIKTKIKDSTSINNANQPQVQKSPILSKNFYGRISIQSISSVDNQSNSNDLQRWRYSFSLSGDNVFQSKLSFSSYFYFSYNTKEWSTIKKDLTQNLRVYDLALKYEFTNNAFLWAGRHINPKVSNVGTLDGLQFETKISKFYLGTLVGSRPNFYDYSFDAKLFEYGFYTSRIDSIGTKQIENTISFFQQTNNKKTDRRYIYLQHTNNILPSTFLFFSSEIDLFKISNGLNQSTFDLTSMYLSARIDFSSKLSTSLSYDARKNIIYYETYKSFLDTYIDNEIRRGYSASIYYRPTNQIYISANYGYRSRKGDNLPSQNFGMNVSINQIPLLLLSGSLQLTRLTSSYSNGNQLGIRLTKSLSDDVSITSDIRMIQYKFANNTQKLSQLISDFEISYQLPWKMYFSINYEGLFYDKISQSRFFIDLTKRF